MCVDVGFKLYLPLPPASARDRTKGEIVSVDADGGIAAVAGGRPADLFTYDVTVRRVIDGDTLEIAIALTHLELRVKLRLRGLDCPEINTPESKAAKRVVEALVRDAKAVTVYTSNLVGWLGGLLERWSGLQFWLLHAGLVGAAGVLMLIAARLAGHLLNPLGTTEAV